MSLLPGFLDELRTRLSLASVVGRKVTWDMRKSNMGKGDMWAPCPFHQEKSASFHVDDRKGYYYCFGCHAKGDAVTFVKETENVGFMDAVRILAAEAGMQMPARDLQGTQKSDRLADLSRVMEEAVNFYRLQLKSTAAVDARAYLSRRKLTPEAQDRWHIGYAPDGRQSLYAALTAKGIAPGLLIDAGLCAKPDDGGAPYDRFRGRIIFPIRDGRGRAISLGGRAMDPAARAKYLNGPETELFDKGRNLYNHGPAREAAGKGQPLVVAEGYIDVIALCEAGFKSSVAPLGTAVTEDQLRLMWRIHDEPIIALDGDPAGTRAALRVIDLALPLLEAGKGLRFAVLPAGLDPDDLIRTQGPPAMQRVLDAAQPMVQLLWTRETEGKTFDSPERKAALDKSLRAALTRIADPSIRSHYEEDVKRLRWDLFNSRRRSPQPRRKGPYVAPPENARSVTKGSLLAQGSGPVGEIVIEAVILATLITHPALVPRFLTAIERIEVTGSDHATLRALILTHAEAPDLGERIRTAAPAALDALLSHPHVCNAPGVRQPEDIEKAMMCLAQDLAKLEAERGSQREIADGVEDIANLADEGLTWRISQSNLARQDAVASRTEAANDLGEDRPQMLSQLDAILKGISSKKKL